MEQYDWLRAQVAARARITRRGEVFLPCPWCGKDVGKKPTHFSFNIQGAYCFACGQGCRSLGFLAKKLEQQGLLTAPVARSTETHTVQALAPPKWRAPGPFYIRRWMRHPRRIELWQRYRPGLRPETMDAYQLGVGVLPSVACEHERLIVPIYADGELVALRGRAMSCGCPKWLNAGGSNTALFGLDLIERGQPVCTLENVADAMLYTQQQPRIRAVAPVTGCTTWLPQWTRRLVQLQVASVLVAYDHDLAGNCTRTHCAQCEAAWQEWRARTPPTIHDHPAPFGPRLVAELTAADLFAALYLWPTHSPYQDDVGQFLIRMS